MCTEFYDVHVLPPAAQLDADEVLLLIRSICTVTRPGVPLQHAAMSGNVNCLSMVQSCNVDGVHPPTVVVVVALVSNDATPVCVYAVCVARDWFL